METTEFIIDKLYQEDIHPTTGEYAPNLSQVCHVMEILTDLLESGRLSVEELPEVIDLLREKSEETQIQNLAISNSTNFGLTYMNR